MSDLLGGIFLTVGLVIASVSGCFFWGTRDLLRSGLRSPGKVVELRKSPTSRYYSPVVEFETADHRVITAACKISSNPPTHKVGDSVTVLYRAMSPEHIRLDEPFHLWFLTCLFGGLSLIFAIIGGAMLVF
jgi:hypothetical protein